MEYELITRAASKEVKKNRLGLQQSTLAGRLAEL